MPAVGAAYENTRLLCLQKEEGHISIFCDGFLMPVIAQEKQGAQNRFKQ